MAARFLRVAHRGFAAVALENSLDAIERALALGCDEIEVDVRRTAAGRIVLHHDDAEAPGAPLLADALRLIGGAGAGVMLDIKQGGVAEAVVRLLDQHVPDARVIASGSAGEVLRIKRLRPRVLAGRSWPSGNFRGVPVLEQALATSRRLWLPHTLDEILEGFDALVAFHRVLGPRAIDRCHALGREVYAWTLDDPKRVERLRAWGVDGVISDHPSSFGLEVDLPLPAPSPAR